MGDFDGPPGAADGRCTAAHGVIFLAVVPVEVKAARVSFHGGATASLLDSVAISKRVEGARSSSCLEMVTTMTVLELPTKDSLSTCVSLLPRKGV